MEETLNTVNYFIAGFIVIFGSIFGYLISLVVRWRNLNQEMEILEDISKK